MATYRTRTYIAGDWDHDEDAVNKLHQWNNSNYWSLSFTDAHDLTQSNKAVEAGIKVIVLYKSAKIEKSKCPDAVKDVGVHATMCYRGEDGKLYWDYQSVKAAFDASDNS